MHRSVTCDTRVCQKRWNHMKIPWATTIKIQVQHTKKQNFFGLVKVGYCYLLTLLHDFVIYLAYLEQSGQPHPTLPQWWTIHLRPNVTCILLLVGYCWNKLTWIQQLKSMGLFSLSNLSNQVWLSIGHRSS